MKDLVPAYLPSMPLDPYSPDGKTPLHYVVGKHGPSVYSVGDNGKDEGGYGDDLVGGASRFNGE
jgi:hypothetical protein